MSARALILMDHGSRRADADRYLQAIAEAIRSQRPDLAIYVAHLDIAPPSLGETLARCRAAGAEHVAIYPFFLAPGHHLERDVPEQIARARAAHPELRVELLEPLGSRPELAELVLRSYEASAAPARPSKPLRK
jgi:sirohydrochlorin ferrochelatase